MSGANGNGNASQLESYAARQCVKYSFFKVDPAFRRLPREKQEALKLELIDAIRSFNRRMLLRSYSLFGIRGDVDFMLWQVAERLDDFTALHAAIFSTGLAGYLTTPFSLLGMTRKSIYDIGVTDEGEEAERIIIQPGDGRYLFVYPFVKTRAWYALPMEKRQEMMSEHIRVGRKYPQFKLNTIYSFGLDDQEFVVAFEGDSSAAFLDLVMDLRETAASTYTLRDTPTFSCINMTLAETLDSIGGAPVAEIAGPDVQARDGWAQTIRLAELPPGGSAKVYLGSQQVALFNVDGRLYAVNNRCPHARGPLCEGRVEAADGSGPSVVCPWHDAAFDLATGEALHGPVRSPVQAYRVRVGEDGYVYVAETSWVEAQAGATS